MTPSAKKWTKIAGLVLHILIAAMMILADSLKIAGLMPTDQTDKIGLTDWIRVIGIGEVSTALLLLVPRTSSLGILLTSSFWGGAICIHMVHNDVSSIAFVSVLLLLSWVGAFLRNPATFSSFFHTPESGQKTSGPAVPVLS